MTSELVGPQITPDMVRELLNPKPGRELWLSYQNGAWSLVVAGGVDGTEEHIITRPTAVGRAVRNGDGWDYVLTAWALRDIVS